MRRLVCTLLMTGCFAPTPPTGQLLCGDNDSCPDGYQCKEGACWKPGTGPDLAVTVLDDMSVPEADLANDDLANADLATPDAALDMLGFVLGDTYLSDCVAAPELASNVPAAHKQLLLSFNPAHSFGTATTYYFSDVCSTPILTVSTSLSTISLSPGTTTNTRYVSSTVQSVQWRPEASVTAQSFIGNSTCGITSWAAGVFVDVTGRSCSGVVPVPTTGAIFLSYLQIDVDTLETAGGSTTDASAPWPAFGPPLYHVTCKLVAPQSGCSGSQRCSLPLLPTCLPAGATAIGAMCDPLNDTCTAGTQCTPTPDGGAAPACRQICLGQADCTQAGPGLAPSAKATCFSPLVTVVQKLCTLNCEPVSTLGQPLGCPAGNNCKVFNLGQVTAHADCVAPVGIGTDGASCSTGDDCAVGFDCANGHCRSYCRTGTNGDCAAGTCVNTGAGAWGRCCPGGVC